MSASLIVLIPVVLLGLVTFLCFTGCVLHTHGQGEGFGPYQDAILKTSNLVAFWPLDDQPSPDVAQPEAVDIAPKQAPLNPFTGLYTGPDGSFTLNHTGIVVGDVSNGLTPCAAFNGGFVQVGFQPDLNPLTSFSIEAWAQPEQPTGDVMMVVASDDLNAFTGYQLHATAENTWAAAIALGPGPGQTFLIAKPPVGSPPNISFGVPTHLVATFDSTSGTLTLFVNGQMSVQRTITPPMPQFAPSILPTPFSIGALSAADSQQAQFPFSGEIQDVAFYNAALTSDVIMQHFTAGITSPG
jgi:concanavalin A-like lectin/glucanase superfamily protein